MNVVLFHDDRQRETINHLIRDLGFDDLSEVATRVESLEDFHRAEAYHQKYYLRQDNALSGFVDGWSDRRITDSPVAALLNGMAAGHLAKQEVHERSRELGLSAEFTEAICKLQHEPTPR